MIKVFGAPPTRALRVIWMLEELGLPYEVHQVDFPNRLQDKAFIACSPTGALPGIEDGDVRMMESVAIVEYLGTRHGPSPLVPPPGDPCWPAFLSWLHFGEGSLTAPLNVAIGTRFFAPEDQKQNWGALFAIDIFVRKSAALVAPLKRGPWLLGDTFTAADISCGYALGLARPLALEDRIDPVLVDYADRCRERPAYKAAAAHGQPLPVQANPQASH
ncbi:MAG TPA: glutathione S-transferase family protein [Allosphingosinicella sp.]|jgi:glutathione S-transferase|nr:glutathione S-transferase family protein [Allosphingosinicella sp.]